MTTNFGGKKAAPFRAAGKRRVAKAVVASARRAKREMALSVITGRTIDLGRDGSKWKHGWIPLNAAAVALKGGKGHNSVASREEHGSILSRHIKETAAKSRAASEPGNWYDTPTHTSSDGRTASIGISHSDGKAFYGSTVTTASGERMHVRHNSAKAAHEHVMNHLYPVSGQPAEKPTVSSDLSPQEKIANTVTMHGTGSKQHMKALLKFGNDKQKLYAGARLRKMKGV